MQTELAEDKVPAKNESQGASPLVLKLIARKNSNSDNSQNWGSLETTLLAVASGLVLLVYAAACCGYLGLSSFQRVVLVILIGPAALRAITLGALQRDINASGLYRERLILFAGSLVVMVVTTCLALAAFLIVGIPLSILAGANCWNGSKEPTTDLRIRVAFILAIFAAVSATALIIFETWIAYFVFYRPKEGLPVGVERFLRLQRAGGLVVGSFLLGIAGTWATMVVLVNAATQLHLPLPFQGENSSTTERLYILLAVTFFGIWGGISLAIWTWLLRRGYRIR